jgi:hypothetical protein
MAQMVRPANAMKNDAHLAGCNTNAISIGVKEFQKHDTIRAPSKRGQ